MDSSDKDLDTDIDSETKPVDVNGTDWEPGAVNSSLSEVKEAPDACGRTAPATWEVFWAFSIPPGKPLLETSLEGEFLTFL